MTDYTPQQTIKYKTYVKTATVEALRDVYTHHVDPMLKKTHVGIDYPRKEADYPTIVVRFFERNIMNAGVGHQELIDIFDRDTGEFFGAFKFKHYFYKGDIEFAILALSSLDRDLVGDALVQTLAMGNLDEYTNRFFSRIYADENKVPDAISHYIGINTDNIMGFGENQAQTPWGSEDDLIYQTSYRVAVFGEFYSLPPEFPAPLIEKVKVYPYIEGLEPLPTGNPDDGDEWEPPFGLA